MSATSAAAPPPTGRRDRLPLAFASRGDALTPYLLRALERRFVVDALIDPELTRTQRMLVAGMTFRPDRSRWVERFYKSPVARRLRTGNAERQLRAASARVDLVFQVHHLFDVPGAPTVLYVDCTHRQSAAQWAPWNPLHGLDLERWYRQEQDAYRGARHLFAFSTATRDSLVEEYGVEPERVTVVGGGMNLDSLPEPTRRHEGPPTVLFVGNDFTRKGGEVLLEAFSRLRARVPDARLRLVGTRPRIPTEPGVEVIGRVRERARIAELYAEADVFALPSFFDPYPLVLLEAMAFGLPVVASRQMGVPEMVEDGRNGRLVEPGDPFELASTLERVLVDRAGSAALGREGRRRVAETGTWDAVVDRMMPALTAAGAAW